MAGHRAGDETIVKCKRNKVSIVFWTVYDNVPASQNVGGTYGVTDNEYGSSGEEIYSNSKDDYMACCNEGRSNRCKTFLYLQFFYKL